MKTNPIVPVDLSINYRRSVQQAVEDLGDRIAPVRQLVEIIQQAAYLWEGERHNHPGASNGDWYEKMIPSAVYTCIDSDFKAVPPDTGLLLTLLKWYERELEELIREVGGSRGVGQ